MELDIEKFDALQRYLAAHGHIDPGEIISFRNLLGGVSNRTVRVTRAGGRAWVLKQALPKLRVTADWFSSPERICVEAKALRWLNRLTPPGTTPPFAFEDPSNHLLAMEAIPEDHENWKSVLLSGRINRDHFEQFGLLLGAVHGKSAESGLEACMVFSDTSYFESLRLEPYYLYTASKVSAAAAFLSQLVRETLSRKLCLVHGDFSPKNILIHRGRLVLLDYEVVHFGDPAFDVGFALTHFLSKAHHMSSKRDVIARASRLFWKTYFKKIASLGWDGLEARTVRHALGCLLARVAGKSPIEYLTTNESARQRDITLLLMAAPPTRVTDLISEFIERTNSYAKD
jgi:5-methylthioribose kinase